MTIFRKDLCNFPSLVVAHANSIGCEIGEAVDDLVTILTTNEELSIYDGSWSTTVQPFESTEQLTNILYAAFNYKWWLGDVWEFGFSPYNILINKNQAIKVLGIKDIPEVDENYFLYTVNNKRKNTVSTDAGYKSSLMKLMDLTLERYYGNQFDLNDSDTWPKQKNVIEWLRNEHGLSEREATSIDIVIRPDMARKK